MCVHVQETNLQTNFIKKKLSINVYFIDLHLNWKLNGLPVSVYYSLQSYVGAACDIKNRKCMDQYGVIESFLCSSIKENYVMDLLLTKINHKK